MVDVFLSYSVYDDQAIAHAFRDYLALNHAGVLRPILASEFRSDAEEGAAKIQRLISRCPFFVVFYTAHGCKNQWVNQELGYALALAGPNRIRIIPLYNDRKDFAGMLHTRIDNLASQFKIPTEAFDDLWKEVAGFMIEEFQGPLSLDTRMRQQAHAGAFVFDLHLLNTLSRTIVGATIHFITPMGVEVRVPKNATPFVKWLDGVGGLVFTDQPLALPLRNRVEPVPPLQTDHLRTTWMLLEEFPMASGAQRFEVVYPAHLKSFSIAIVASVPFSEPSVYELPVVLAEDRWYLSKLKIMGPLDKARISMDPFT